jgi:hypothetical protein
VGGNLKPIRDPVNASFFYAGGMVRYDQFCGYFRTNVGVTIKGVSPTTPCWDWGW